MVVAESGEGQGDETQADVFGEAAGVAASP